MQLSMGMMHTVSVVSQGATVVMHAAAGVSQIATLTLHGAAVALSAPAAALLCPAFVMQLPRDETQHETGMSYIVAEPPS